MEIERIALSKLRDHPGNANVMGEECLAKLARHIRDSGRYEPLVVRRDPSEEGCWQLINGHHRKRVLEQLGHQEAECVVWEVNDEETLMLLATMNRLTGQDDPRRRGELLERLGRKFQEETLRLRLPEGRRQITKLLELRKGPTVRRPEELGEMPQAMTFFVSERQRRLIEGALRGVRAGTAGDDPEGKMTRGDLLACLAAGYVERRT